MRPGQERDTRVSAGGSGGLGGLRQLGSLLEPRLLARKVSEILAVINSGSLRLRTPCSILVQLTLKFIHSTNVYECPRCTWMVEQGSCGPCLWGHFCKSQVVEAHGGQWGTVGVSPGLSLQEPRGCGLARRVQLPVGCEGGSAASPLGPATSQHHTVESTACCSRVTKSEQRGPVGTRRTL